MAKKPWAAAKLTDVTPCPLTTSECGGTSVVPNKCPSSQPGLSGSWTATSPDLLSSAPSSNATRSRNEVTPWKGAMGYASCSDFSWSVGPNQHGEQKCGGWRKGIDKCKGGCCKAQASYCDRQCYSFHPARLSPRRLSCHRRPRLGPRELTTGACWGVFFSHGCTWWDNSCCRNQCNAERGCTTYYG